MSATEQAIDQVTANAATLSDLMVQAGLAIKEMAEQHGDKAVELSLFAARIDAISVLLTFLNLFLFASLVTYAGWRVWKWGNKEENKRHFYGELRVKEDVWVTSIIFGLFGGFLYVASFSVFQLSALIGIFVPEYWLLIKAVKFF